MILKYDSGNFPPAGTVRRLLAFAASCALPLTLSGQEHLKADLVIEAVQVAPSNPTRLRIKVANRGLSPAVETQLSLSYQDGGATEVRSAAVPLLMAGERQWLVAESGSLLLDADRVSLWIDDPDRVDESDEDNNGAEFP